MQNWMVMFIFISIRSIRKNIEDKMSGAKQVDQYLEGKR